MVTNASGSVSASQSIIVAPASALEANFTFTPSLPVVGQTVNFLDASVGTPQSYQWDFGDGFTSALQNPTHVFTMPGAYLITLNISAGSESSTHQETIAVDNTDVITAASPSFSDVRAAVSRAKAGDTVIVPSGSATWTSNLVITKGIKLIGAGIGQTVITGGYTNSGSYFETSGYLISYEPSHPELNEPFRLSGFTINFSNRCWGILLRNRTISAINKVRIDHCNLSGSKGGAELIMAYGTVYGCIDNCVMDGGYFMFRSLGLNDKIWSNLRFDFGTGDNLYFEDNEITVSSQDCCIEGGAGGRYAIRHNIIRSNYNAFAQCFDIHGNSRSSNHATMGAEIYDNTIYYPNIPSGGQFVDHRGGKLLYYNNNIISPAPTFFVNVREEARDSENLPASSPISGQPQHISDSYYWNNMRNGTPIATSSYSISGTVNYGAAPSEAPFRVVPQWNLDCWRETTPFTGAAGVGVGPLSARPSTGLTVGVGYWATDTKTLYRATSATTWEVYYAPYTYPHPLRDMQ